MGRKDVIKMDTVIQVKCIDQTLIITNSPVIASGGLNENKLECDFCEKWDGFSKTAVFYQDKKNVYYSLLDGENTCFIPQEVLQESGTLYFGIFGNNDSGVTRTSEILRYKIVEGAITKDLKPSDPTPSIYEQLLAKYQHLIEVSEETLEREKQFEQNFFQVGNVEPTEKPCLWFNTSGREQSEELLELSSNTDDSDVNASINGSEYAVKNASLNSYSNEYNVETEGVEE